MLQLGDSLAELSACVLQKQNRPVRQHMLCNSKAHCSCGQLICQRVNLKSLQLHHCNADGKPAPAASMCLRNVQNLQQTYKNNFMQLICDVHSSAALCLAMLMQEPMSVVFQLIHCQYCPNALMPLHFSCHANKQARLQHQYMAHQQQVTVPSASPGVCLLCHKCI